MGNDSFLCILHTLQSKTKNTKLIGPLGLRMVKILMKCTNIANCLKESSVIVFIVSY